MPKSRSRKKAAYVPPPTAKDPKSLVSPRWLVPLMIAFFVVGLLWIVIYYLGGPDTPLMGALGNWNLLVGFGFLAGGFVCATQWK